MAQRQTANCKKFLSTTRFAQVRGACTGALAEPTSHFRPEQQTFCDFASP
jgi:hypothetical protein